MLAHDLGNVLSPIKVRLDMVRRRLVRDDRADDLDDIEQASRSMHRLERMAGELLDVARLEKGLFSLSIEVVDLVGLVDEVVAEYRPIRESITVSLPEELRVPADPVRITQVLNNLLTNAVTHTPPAVPIQVRVGTEDHDGKRWAVVHIHDDGPGIPDAAVEGLLSDLFRVPDRSVSAWGCTLRGRSPKPTVAPFPHSQPPAVEPASVWSFRSSSANTSFVEQSCHSHNVRVSSARYLTMVRLRRHGVSRRHLSALRPRE